MGEKVLKYMTLDEASDYTRIPISSLREKISLGLLPAYKPGKCLLLDVKDVEIFMKKSKVVTAP